MEQAEDTQERKEDVMRIVRWGLGGLALAAMACWSVSVVVFAWGGLLYWSEQGVALGNSVILRACALALAPWVIGGIVLGVRWWRSRTPASPQASE